MFERPLFFSFEQLQFISSFSNLISESIEAAIFPSTSTLYCSKTFEGNTAKGRWYTGKLFAFNIISEIMVGQYN